MRPRIGFFLSGFGFGDDTLLKMNETDQQLLQRFTRHQAEDAFAEIIRRHLNLVYSAALRQVQSSQLAKDVSQSVFNDLARSADNLKKDSVLSAWLYEVTRRTSIDVIRRESRRQLREQIYTEMNAINATTEDWRDVLPHLDAAMEELDSTDRAAVLLRFFENKSLREVGEELGVSDDAARKRVGRAVERLREFLSKRGVTIGAGGLVVLVSANAVQAAPAGLAANISVAALTSAPGSAITAASGTAKLLAGTTLRKAFVVASLGVATVAAILIASHSDPPAKPQPTAASLQKSAATLNQPAAPDDASTTNRTDPDPVALLRGVKQARQRIHSGTVEIQDTIDRFDNGRKDTREWRFVASFDETKLRFESFGREYSYKFDEDEEKQNDIIKRADSMDRESAVRAGLSEESMAHHTLVSDGTTVYDHYQSSHQSPGVSISAVTNGTAGYIFDPRGIGLSTYLSMHFSAADGLYTKGAEFRGEENLDGIPTYHVRVGFGSNEAPMDYWLDKARPERLLQLSYGLDKVKSRYDEMNLSDPLPIEVTTTCYRNGVLSDITRLVCTSSTYNTPVDAESFTLAGLGLAVGTIVIDTRNDRILGYWTGSGLSENPPSTKTASSQPAPRLDELLAVLENEPGSSNGLQCATRIILNTPDGDPVQKAAAVILRDHVSDTNLVHFCQELDRVRPSCSKELLTGLLQKNPSIEVRGNACLTLATILKSEAKYGQNKEATTRAVEQYERVINEFSSVKLSGYSLAELAKPELMELQKLIIGKPAPDTEGVDLNGQPLKLNSYRGRVTVVVFWAGQFTEAPRFHKLAEDMAGKPFALVGVNCDDDSTRKEEYVKKVTWPSFRDGRDGPISKLWNVRSWTDTWVLDREGVIRYRNVRDSDLRDAVNKLLEE